MSRKSSTRGRLPTPRCRTLVPRRTRTACPSSRMSARPARSARWVPREAGATSPTLSRRRSLPAVGCHRSGSHPPRAAQPHRAAGGRPVARRETARPCASDHLRRAGGRAGLQESPDRPPRRESPSATAAPRSGRTNHAKGAGDRLRPGRMVPRPQQAVPDPGSEVAHLERVEIALRGAARQRGTPRGGASVTPEG